MKFRAITTCNAAGWKATGRNMVSTFVEHWDGVPLTVYAEGFQPKIRDLDECFEVAALPTWLDELKAQHAKNADAHGMATGEYNYRRDFIRFAHKVAAITDAAKRSNDVLIWLDADTLTHEDVLPGWLASLFPQPAYVAWLDRPRSYPECGFVMFNGAHVAHAAVMQRLEDIYRSSNALGLNETHDSYVIKQVIEGAWSEGMIERPHNLSVQGGNNGHPFLDALGSRLDHCKGKRKIAGRSPKSERTIKDGTRHWA